MRRSLLLAFLIAAACTPSPPTREPDITGTVTRVSDDGTSVLVEERPQDTSGSAKAALRITTQTHIWGADGTPAPATDLRVGVVVRAWFDGPVAESYPLQVAAGHIAIASGVGLQLYALSKGGPAVVLRVNGHDETRLACNGGVAIVAGADRTPQLPWDLVVVRESDGTPLLAQRVATLPQWLLVTRDSAALSTQPVAGPFVPCP